MTNSSGGQHRQVCGVCKEISTNPAHLAFTKMVLELFPSLVLGSPADLNAKLSHTISMSTWMKPSSSSGMENGAKHGV